jgi:hypothetical protein
MAYDLQTIDKPTADERLGRFQGTPGKTKGLGTVEMLELFQHLIDSGEAYTLNDGTQYHIEAWAADGFLKNFEQSRMQP